MANNASIYPSLQSEYLKERGRTKQHSGPFTKGKTKLLYGFNTLTTQNPTSLVLFSPLPNLIPPALGSRARVRKRLSVPRGLYCSIAFRDKFAYTDF